MGETCPALETKEDKMYSVNVLEPELFPSTACIDRINGVYEDRWARLSICLSSKQFVAITWLNLTGMFLFLFLFILELFLNHFVWYKCFY